MLTVGKTVTSQLLLVNVPEFRGGAEVLTSGLRLTLSFLRRLGKMRPHLWAKIFPQHSLRLLIGKQLKQMGNVHYRLHRSRVWGWLHGWPIRYPKGLISYYSTKCGRTQIPWKTLSCRILLESFKWAEKKKKRHFKNSRSNFIKLQFKALWVTQYKTQEKHDWMAGTFKELL